MKVKTLGFVALVAAAFFLGSCGDADKDDATSTTTIEAGATTTPARDSETESADEDVVGTLTVDGDEYDLTLAPDRELRSPSGANNEALGEPCALEGDQISVVVDANEAYLFVAEGPSANELSVRFFDSPKSATWSADKAIATIDGTSFDYSGTLDGRLGPLDVKVALTC